MSGREGLKNTSDNRFVWFGIDNNSVRQRDRSVTMVTYTVAIVFKAPK